MKFYPENIYVDRDCGYTCRYNFSATEAFELHYHDYYEIFLTVTDNVLHHVNGSQFKLCKNSLVFIRPSDVHTYVSEDDTSFSFVNLTFSKETIHLLFDYLKDGLPIEPLLNSKYPAVVILSDEEQRKLLKKLNDLNTIDWQDKANLKFNMRILLAQIFSEYFSIHHTKEESGVPQWLQDLCLEMKKAKYFCQGPAILEELSGKSREHIARSFKKYYQTSPSGFLNDLRINYATNMLINTNRSILDICYECGFQNPSWFYKKFKEKYQVSPKAFRKGLNLKKSE